MSIVSNILKIQVAALMAATVFSCFGSSGGDRRQGPAAPAASASTEAAEDKNFPVRYGYTVKKVYPHNETSYTQGLYWDGGYLWEGTGQYGQSALMQVELETGSAVRGIDLERKYFGEGIALLDGKIFQLTWYEGKCFVYDASSLALINTFEYSGQGWGLTTDGRYLYMSNGTHEIYVLDPSDFSRQRTIRVKLGRRSLNQLNELEWIDGRIWSNIYGLDQIAIINPENGVVEGLIDLAGLLPASERTPGTDVLNGIAYDESTGRIFVTGKNWSRLFEIEITEK